MDICYVAICTFEDGYISGAKELYVGDTETEEECARLVKTRMPHAMGATYEPKTKN